MCAVYEPCDLISILTVCSYEVTFVGETESVFCVYLDYVSLRKIRPLKDLRTLKRVLVKTRAGLNDPDQGSTKSGGGRLEFGKG